MCFVLVFRCCRVIRKMSSALIEWVIFILRSLSLFVNQIKETDNQSIWNELYCHFVLFDRRTSRLSMKPSCMKELSQNTLTQYEFFVWDWVWLCGSPRKHAHTHTCGFSCIQYYGMARQRFYSNRDNGQTPMWCSVTNQKQRRVNNVPYSNLLGVCVVFGSVSEILWKKEKNK